MSWCESLKNAPACPDYHARQQTVSEQAIDLLIYQSLLRVSDSALTFLAQGTLQGIQYGSSTGSLGRKSGRIVNLHIRQKIQIADTVSTTRIQTPLEAQYIWAPEARVAIKS